MSERRLTKGEQTKARILRAARQAFAESPYDQVTTRSIASKVGIDAALIHRYFGSKEGLFAAVIENGILIENLGQTLAPVPLAHLGEAIARYGIQLWSSPRGRALMALLRRVLAENPQAIQRVLVPRFEQIVAAKCDYPPAQVRVRVGLCLSQMLGFILARQVIEVEALKALETEQAVQLIAPVLQRYLSDPLICQ